MSTTPRAGDQVEYLRTSVFDELIVRGDVGVVVKVDDGWVTAEWPRSGSHSVPVTDVRLVGAGDQDPLAK